MSETGAHSGRSWRRRPGRDSQLQVRLRCLIDLAKSRCDRAELEDSDGVEIPITARLTRSIARVIGATQSSASRVGLLLRMHLVSLSMDVEQLASP